MTVSNFIYKINNNHEALAYLTDLVCKGGCYTDIQSAVEYCTDNPMDDECMNSVSCDCMVDLLNVIETLESNDGDFLKVAVDEEIIDVIQQSGTTCRCVDLNSHALSLETSPKCSFAKKIVNDGNILAGDTAVLTDTCSFASSESSACAGEVVNVVDGFIEYLCALTDADGDFIYTLSSSKDTFNALTRLACQNSECYSALRTCQNDSSCAETLSCDCMREFLSIVKNLSPDDRKDLLMLDTAVLDSIQGEFGKCECNRLNELAANIQTEEYCALHDSIVQEGIVVSNLTSNPSTCAGRLYCVGNITKTVTEMSGHQGCSIKQKTDKSAKFVYIVNDDSGDLDRITDMICNNADCYNEINVYCTTNAVNDVASTCAKSVRFECLVSFISMFDSLSDDGKDLLGVDSSLLDKMRARIELERKDETVPQPTNTNENASAAKSNDTSSFNNETSTNSGSQSAVWTALLCIIINVAFSIGI